MSYGTETRPYPSTAFALSLIAGIFVILGGLVVIAVFAFLATLVPFAGLGAVEGIIGIVFGVIILFAAYQLRAHPDQHVLWGVIVLVFSIISWFGSFGGLVIGFILGLIGGIMAIVWRPPAMVAPGMGQPMMGQPMAPPVPGQPPMGQPMTMPVAPVAPAPTAAAAGVNCPRCGRPATFVPQYNRYYCYGCQQYV